MDTTHTTTKTLDLDSIALDSSPVIAAFLRAWSDYTPLVVGTNRGPDLDERLAWMVTDWVVRVQAPAWLRLAGLAGQAEILEGLPEMTQTSVPAIQGSLEAVRKDAAAVRASAWDAAWDAARAAWDAAWDAACDATRAATSAAWDATRAATRDTTMDAARDTACAAAWDAACAAAWDAASAAATDAADVRVAARAAATAALDPTTRDLQASAHDLLDRMITVASEDHG